MSRIIRVNIDQSQHAVRFEKGASFFETELERALGIIKNHVRTLPKDLTLHRHETIAVLGGRGLGKTSFVLSLLDRAEKELKEGIARLPILDPTLIEHNEIFLATVTSAIVQKLDERHMNTHGDPDQKLTEALDRIARAFPVLSPRGDDLWPKPDSDPMDLAERMLRSAGSGRNLSESFANFVNTAAESLGVVAFILPLDDVDTAFERGWLVLETLRKYLATPRLITVLSGDFNLYQMLVLRHNYDQLQSLVKAEEVFAGQNERATALSKYRDQAQNLRDQYLTKVLPPHRRIHIRWLRDQLSAARGPAPIQLKLTWTNDSAGEFKDIPLEEIIGYVARDLFGWPLPLNQDPEDGPILLMTPGRNPTMGILPSNTRNFLRLLKALCPWYVGDKKKSASDGGVQDLDLEGLYQSFTHALYEAEIEIDTLRALAHGGGRDWLARRVWSQSVQEANAFFLTGPRRRESEEIEQAFLLVQGAFYHGCREAKDVSACLDYGIRIVAPALVISRPDGQDERDEQYKALAYRVQLDSELPTVDVAGHLRAATWKSKLPRAAGYMRLLKRRRKDNLHVAIRKFAKSKAGSKARDFGVYRWWNALKGKDLHPQKEQDILPTLEGFWSHSDDVSGQILALYFMTLHNEYGSEFSFIDLYQGLGNLAGLLQEVGEATGTVQEFLKRRSNETRSYAISLADTEEQDDAGEGVDDDDAEEGEVEPYQPSPGLEHALSRWVEAARSLADMDRPPHSPPFHLPVPQIGRVFERLERQMKRILEDVGEPGWSVGAMLERWTAAFWQNLLLVELEYRLGPEFSASGLSQLGVVKTTTELEKNLQVLEQRIGGQHEAAAVAQWKPDELRWRVPRNALLWMSCPVLLACCRPELRSKIFDLVKMVEENLASVERKPDTNGEPTHWATQLRESMDACEKIFPHCTWKFADNSKHQFDIHELWCALFVAPGPKSQKPTEADYTAFRAEMKLTLGKTPQPAKDETSP